MRKGKGIDAKIFGSFILLLGLILLYETSTSQLLPQVAIVFYSLSVLMVVSGIFVIVARIR